MFSRLKMNKNKKGLTWLQGWYESNCDGNWEHEFGLKIETLDNPGWSIEIDLIETSVENTKFSRVKVENTELDWYRCYIKDNKFHGVGGPKNLIDILQVFHDWAEEDKA